MGKVWDTSAWGANTWDWDAWADAASGVSIPTVTTETATDILKSSLTGNGTITATGGANATRRGFLYMPGASGDPVTGNLLTNYSFETGDPPDDWGVDGAGATFSRSSDYAVHGTYSAKLIVASSTTTNIGQGISSPSNYDGKTMTAGCWVKADVASRVRVVIYDNDGGGFESSASSYHSGSGDWEWLEVTRTLRTSLTNITVQAIRITAGAVTTVYADEAVFVEASSLGELIYSNISTVYDDGSFSTGAFTKSITGLDTASPYRIRAYATNSAGTGYGDTVSATTATEEPTTRAVDVCLEIELDGGTERYSIYGMSNTYHWDGRLLSFSAIRRSIPLGGGLGTVGNCTIKLADADREFREDTISDYVTRRVNLYIADSDTGSLYQVMTGKIQTVDFDESSFSIRVKDDSYKKLQEFVSDKIIQDRTDWTDLPATLKAVLVPILQGMVSSTNYRNTGYFPAYLVDPAEGQSEYRYAACQGHATITKVYRDGVEIDSGDWAQTQTVDPDGDDITYIDCDYDQRDGADLTKETITWDGTGPNGTATYAEAVEEVLKLKGWDSDDYDTTAFSAADTLYDDAAKTILSGVGVVDKEQRLEDFLTDIGKQASAYFFYTLAGKLSMIFESWEVPGSTDYDYVLDDSIIQSISTKTVSETRTALKTSYAFDWRDGESSWVRTYEDSGELTRQGSVSDTGRFDIPFAYDASSADSLIYCQLKGLSSERQIITLRTAAIAELELGDYIKVISNFGSGSDGYEALLCRVLGIEIAVNRDGGIDNVLTLVDHAGDAFPSISSADTAGVEADVVEDSRDIGTNIVFSSSDYDEIEWTSGTIKMPSGQTFAISSGTSTGWGNYETRYIYFDPDSSKTALQVTTSYSTLVSRRGYLLCSSKKSEDTSSTAPFQVQYGLGDYSGSTFTGSVFQTSTGNPKVRIDATNFFQLINGSGTTIISMDPTDYFQLNDASANTIIDMTPANGLRLYDASGNLRIQLDNDTNLFSGYDTSGKRLVIIDGNDVALSSDGLNYARISATTNSTVQFIDIAGAGLQIDGTSDLNLDCSASTPKITTGTAMDLLLDPASGLVLIDGDLELDDYIEFSGGSNTSYLKMRDADGNTRYASIATGGSSWTISASAP